MDIIYHKDTTLIFGKHEGYATESAAKVAITRHRNGPTPLRRNADGALEKDTEFFNNLAIADAKTFYEHND